MSTHRQRATIDRVNEAVRNAATAEERSEAERWRDDYIGSPACRAELESKLGPSRDER